MGRGVVASLAVACLVAGCGGGIDESESSTPSAPSETVETAPVTASSTTEPETVTVGAIGS